MVVQRGKSYRARTVATELVRQEPSAFKIYALEIPDRPEPRRYLWSRSGMSIREFAAAFREAGHQGIGFVTAFPHITKVFRFSPAAETTLLVRALDTRTLAPLALERGEGYLEFACLAEALIAADEYRLWAQAGSVEEYLEGWSSFREGEIRAEAKLWRYWPERL